ncbi:hypothetical protein F4819DRAFT_489922 [Hypoxylon fuscum]|nr:hypothetical protein F4819DRAFT_489922 [Hypoxylon fuscum]
MPHATKKSARQRVTSAFSAPVQYPSSRAQSSATPSSSSYAWTAADAAKASRDGAFLTAWPRDESYYTPPVHLLDQGYQGYQNQGQSQSQGQGQGQTSQQQQQQQQLQLQYYYSSRNKPSATSNQGGSGGGGGK